MSDDVEHDIRGSLIEYEGDLLAAADVVPIDAGGSGWVASLVGWDEMFLRVEKMKLGEWTRDRVLKITVVGPTREDALAALLAEAERQATEG